MLNIVIPMAGRGSRFANAGYHKIATEFTVIVSGEVEMNGQRYSKGDIIVIAPGEGTDFEALTPTITAVVKLPGAAHDKYLAEIHGANR